MGSIVPFARSRADQPVRLFTQDESRFGLHLPCYRRLTNKGVKPRQPFELLYEYYWLYGAVEPASGENFFLELPHLNSDCFTVFLAQLSRHYHDSLNIMLIDGAPAHIAKAVEVPENIILIRLPSYSPELNPVERLWLDIKRRIDVYDPNIRSSLPALQDHVAGILRGYSNEYIASLTGYDYIVNAAIVL